VVLDTVGRYKDGKFVKGCVAYALYKGRRTIERIKAKARPKAGSPTSADVAVVEMQTAAGNHLT